MLIKIGRRKLETDEARVLATWTCDKRIAKLYDRLDGRYFVVKNGQGEPEGVEVTKEKAARHFYKRNKHLIENNNSRHFNMLFQAAFNCSLYDLLPNKKKKGVKHAKKKGISARTIGSLGFSGE